MQKLSYPIKFQPILKDKIWGGKKLKSVLNKDSISDTIGESWEISGVDGNISIVSNGALVGCDLNSLVTKYKGEFVGNSVYKEFGNQFPLLLKFIDANRDLSIQVHPDDIIAKERHDSNGKTEMWYVIDSEPKSKLISGFNEKITKDKYLGALNSGNLMSLLKAHEVESGDVFFIPTGNVHATGAGILFAEIQQTSDVTYRIYDYDRKDNQGKRRELHTDLAVDVINYEDENEKVNYKATKNEDINLVKCNYFTTNILILDEVLNKDVSNLDSFIVYMCLEGSAYIECRNGFKENINIGDTVLIPSSVKEFKITPNQEIKLLEVYIE